MKESTSPGGRLHHRAKAGVAALVAIVVYASSAAPVLAGPVDGTPDPSGMPGAQLVSQLVNWLMWVSLMASLGAVLYGAAMWRGGARLGNSPRAEDGRYYVAGGAIGALLSGLAVILVNTLFAIGRAGG